MDNTLTNNKRIAINTITLYFRLLICAGISFFTTRELLAVLGTVNYGLVGVISGVVTMFSFISHTMLSASTRYFTYHIGRNDYNSLKNVFNLTQLLYVFLFVIMLLICETLGLWVFYEKLVIPPDRMSVCVYFYQFTVFSFLLKMNSIPYQSLVVAHEDMATYAAMSVLEYVLQLGNVYVIQFYNHTDPLFVYGILTAMTSLVYFAIYFCYCQRRYKEAKYNFYWDKNLFKELINFSGWNLFGSSATLFSNILVNILLNNYYGATVNAARSIAMHVSTGVSGLMQGFLTAAKPQITKYWSSGNKSQMYKLTETTSKFGFFLMLLISLPVIYETQFLLQLWLKSIPDYAIVFTRLIIVSVLIDTITHPLITVSQATGKVALYQSVIGIMTWLNFPLSWLFLEQGYSPESTLWVLIALKVVCLFLRLIIVQKISDFPFVSFVKNVLIRCICVVLVPIVLLYYRYFFYDIKYSSWLIMFFCVLTTALAIIIIGLNKSEFIMFKGIVLRKISNHKLEK